jgi:putative ABC transport system substrate-binding protein
MVGTRKIAGLLAAAPPAISGRPILNPTKVLVQADMMLSLELGMVMKRREFIKILGGVAASMAAVRKAWAQPAGQTYRLCVLVQTPRTAAHWIAFFDELRKQGMLEGVNLTVLDAFNTPLDRADSVATMMVNARPDAIITAGALTRVLQRATETIPIITVSDDLLAEKVVTSLSHPDRNVTGISILATELNGKRQEILLETFPDTHRLAILADLGVTTPEQLKALENAAKARGIMVQTHIANRADDIMPAIDAALNAGAQALNVLASSLFNRHQTQIIGRMAAARLPAIYQWPEMAEEGGLIAYGPRFVTLYRQQALQVVKVLKGTKPADIPIEQPTKFELVVNLKTAKALGLEVPAMLLARADEVIE